LGPQYLKKNKEMHSRMECRMREIFENHTIDQGLISRIYEELDNKNIQIKFKSMQKSWTSVAHACNPSYSGGRDQEVHSSKPAKANSLQNPISKKTFIKKGWWSGLRCKP
jgi:hypothetical protein